MLVPLAFALLTCHPVRHHAPKVAFALTHPCPANGKPTIHCHGYVIDHIVPLCACGLDDPSNMQWQTVEDAKRKDQIERRQCRTVPGKP